MTLPDALSDTAAPPSSAAAAGQATPQATPAGVAARACCGKAAADTGPDVLADAVTDVVTDDTRRVRQPDKTLLLNRLRRIEGQVRGVTRMVEEDRYCLDLLTQIAALRAALSGISMQLLENHVHGCVAQALREDDGTAAIDELMQVLRRLDGKAFGG